MEEDTIDLHEIKKILLRNKKKLLLIIAVCTLVALIIALVLPKKYESTTLIRTKSQKQSVGGQAAAALAMLGAGGGASGNIQTYMELIKSRAVLEPVIDELDLPHKELVTAKGFATSNLKISNVKGTDLVELTAVGRSPEEAAQISDGITISLQKHLTTANQSESSLTVKFLKDRIALAKVEMEQAEKDLESYRQKEKIFIPDEQGKAFIKKMTEFDQKAAELQVKNLSNQAKLGGINDQLSRQNAAIAEYNMVDDPAIQQIKAQIITKQIALVDLTQKYTDKHPNVQLVNKEIDELTEKLQEQIGNSLKAGTNSLSPIYGGLLKDKVATETELIVGQTAFDAVNKIKGQSENEISQLSAASVTYIGLERQVKITQTVYAELMKSYEQARIQEAQESMDIQIVDKANMPIRPSAPNKTLTVVIGFMLGIMLSAMYVIVTYMRQKKG